MNLKKEWTTPELTVFSVAVTTQSNTGVGGDASESGS